MKNGKGLGVTGVGVGGLGRNNGAIYTQLSSTTKAVCTPEIGRGNTEHKRAAKLGYGE